jgi:hypothetical protein
VFRLSLLLFLFFVGAARHRGRDLLFAPGAGHRQNPSRFSDLLFRYLPTERSSDYEQGGEVAPSRTLVSSMNESGSLNALLVSRILRLREQSGLSIERLGELSMLDRGQVERILDGTEEISIDVVFLLAGALGVEPSTLLEGVEWIPDGKGGGQYRVPDLDD